jgi:hypothetical protein
MGGPRNGVSGGDRVGVTGWLIVVAGTTITVAVGGASARRSNRAKPAS